MTPAVAMVRMVALVRNTEVLLRIRQAVAEERLVVTAEQFGFRPPIPISHFNFA